MNTQELEKKLSYCLYVCDDELLKIDLYEIQRYFIAGFVNKNHVSRLKEIEKEIQRNFRK
jgi:hypothetical protein